MIQLTAQMRILVAVEPADFRCGIDGLARVCRQALDADPFSGTAFVFRNRRATAVKVLIFDGQGFWLCHKRPSTRAASLHTCGRSNRWATAKVQLPPTSRRSRSMTLLDEPVSERNDLGPLRGNARAHEEERELHREDQVKGDDKAAGGQVFGRERAPAEHDASAVHRSLHGVVGVAEVRAA